MSNKLPPGKRSDGPVKPSEPGKSDVVYEQRLHEVMDGLNSSVFVGLLTVDGLLTYANHAALDTIGATAEDVLGKPFESTPWWAFSEDSRQRLRIAIKAAASGVPSRFEIPIKDIGGRMLTMDFTLHPVFGQDGRVSYLVPSAHDITERKQAERALRLTQFAVDHAHAGLFQLHSNGCLQYVNESACRLLGYSQDALLRLAIYDIDAQTSEADWPARWSELKAQGSLRFESMFRHCDGREIPVEISASHIEYEGEEYSFTYLSDMSERKAAEGRIHYLAHYDGLTGLPNRHLLRDRLHQAIAVAERDGRTIWTVFLALDRFKLVNDSFGHKAGDLLLKAISDRLQSATRESDTLARMGGDEFLLILPETTEKGLTTSVLYRVMEAISPPLMVEGQEVFLTCSMGVAVYPIDGTDPDALVEHADVAMYRAKEMGRNNFQFFTPAMNERVRERLRLEGELRNALERAEFVLHYQPQVDLCTGHIVGMEALIRWNHPELGLLPPNHFIGVAEETGLIVPIGSWVIRTASAQAKAWHDAGLGNLKIAVNLSARQFTERDLVQSIADVLRETGLAPGRLEIELTESLMMTDVEQAIDTMLDLKSLGVKLSIDDFGTGYSSLSYLKRFPIDVLKIDKSFVRDITVSTDDAAVVLAIISMAHSMRLHVVAEGVETQEQLDYLRLHGCDEMQGYFFSRPVAADAFEQMLRKGKCLPNAA